MNISIVAAAAIAAVLLSVSADAWSSEPAPKPFLREKRTVFLDHAWSGASMLLDLTTHAGRQYAAYYDAEGRMTIASRPLDSPTWERRKLDTLTKYDSHNHIVMAFDSDGHLHVSGNMHCHPLIYYRTSTPGDVTSLVRIPAMTGELENRVTYPQFFTGPTGELMFTYRHGGSGNGINIVNSYDPKTKSWKRFMEKPLLDGETLMNAYHSGLVMDRTGVWHLAWLWRDTPDIVTAHDVSYARSPGSLANWQRSDGTPVSLPITIARGEIIDSAPVDSGLMTVKLSLDSRDRPLVTYLKLDPRGKTQLYTMRPEDGRWRRYQTTDWPDRWVPRGAGCKDRLIAFNTPHPWTEGSLYQIFFNRFLGATRQVRFLDEETLRTTRGPMPLFPKGFDEVRTGPESDWQVNIVGPDMEELRRTGSTWVLRWEALRSEHNTRLESPPTPSRIEVIEFEMAER